MIQVTTCPNTVYLVLKKELRNDLYEQCGLFFKTFDAMRRSLIGACRNGKVISGTEKREDSGISFHVDVTVHGHHLRLDCFHTCEIERHSGRQAVQVRGVVCVHLRNP